MAAHMDQNIGEHDQNQRPIGPGSERGDMHSPSPSQYKFTSEELRVLKECNRESFFQRSLPLSIGFGVGTFLGVQSGYLKPNPRWGPTPKVIVAVTVGYFLGKFSYQSKCAEKIMQLPNSPLGDMLRRRRQHGKGSFQELTLEPSFGSSMPSVAPQDIYSDIGPQHDLDSDRPYQEGLNEANRPTVDSSTSFIEEEPLPEIPPSHSTTYEELRRKNREDYEQKKTKYFRGVTDTEDIPSVIRPRPQPESSPSKPKNQYGDVWEE